MDVRHQPIKRLVANLQSSREWFGKHFSVWSDCPPSKKDYRVTSEPRLDDTIKQQQQQQNR